MLSTNNNNDNGGGGNDDDAGSGDQRSSLPDTMLPVEEPTTEEASPVTLDQLGQSLNAFIAQFKRLEREHAQLKAAFEAQRRELKRSRVEYQRKIEEWRAFKDSLRRKHGGGRATGTADGQCGISQETASLAILDQDPGKRKRAGSPDGSTPPGFWQVDFTPGIDG